jgi:hypothetical protein
MKWGFHGESVLQQIRTASPNAQEDFRVLMYRLMKDPTSKDAGVLPLRYGIARPWGRTIPGTYTAPFDDALLVYEVLADYPQLNLLAVRWNDRPTSS